MQQDFYENTTIILVGDHLTMDKSYIERTNADRFDRRTYLAVIHPADGCEESGRKRVYTTLDLFPTTLAALGVQIEGNRLGLGVNLFSDEPTLVEQMGLEKLNEELRKKSDFYEAHFLAD